MELFAHWNQAHQVCCYIQILFKTFLSLKAFGNVWYIYHTFYYCVIVIIHLTLTNLIPSWKALYNTVEKSVHVTVLIDSWYCWNVSFSWNDSRVKRKEIQREKIILKTIFSIYNNNKLVLYQFIQLYTAILVYGCLKLGASWRALIIGISCELEPHWVIH